MLVGTRPADGLAGALGDSQGGEDDDDMAYLDGAEVAQDQRELPEADDRQKNGGDQTQQSESEDAFGERDDG